MTPLLLRRDGRTRDGRGYRIRPARDADADGLVALFDAVAAEGPWLAARPGSRSALEERLAMDALLREGGLSLTLEVAGEVAGNATVVRDGEGAEVGLLVAAGVRGEGLGRLLLETCVEWARAVRVGTLRLRVVPGNEPALALYRSLGFGGDREIPAGGSGPALTELSLPLG